MRKRTGLAVGVGLLATVGFAKSASKPRPSPLQGTVRIIEGEAIHEVERGKGEAVIFLHGFGGSTFSWRFALEHFGSRYRAVAMDFPGFGWSSRDAGLPLGHDDHARRVISLMDELGIHRATLVGHSMGGGIAQRVAVRYPERVAGLVLVASIDPNRGATWQRANRRMWGLNFAGAMMECNPRIVRRVVRSALRQMSFDPAWVDDAAVRGYAAPLALPGTSKCLVKLARCAQHDLPVDLAAIRAPVLIVCGETDEAVPFVVSEQLHTAIRGSRLAVVENTGHVVAEERPEAFHALVDDFLAELKESEA